jgi:hypothetical protein
MKRFFHIACHQQKHWHPAFAAKGLRWLGCLLCCWLAASCSTTKHIPDDDQLFVGLTKIEYKDYTPGEHFNSTQEEIEAALATAPNGALFGSSYYRTPFPYGLWIWNYANGSNGKFKQWLNKSFGKAPVLMSQVNPALRASVAQSVLRKNGYMHGDVSYTEVTQKNPKKAKIGYTVRLDTLFTVDSMRYVGFPPAMQALIDSTQSDALISRGTPFAASNLDGERNRISLLMRNNGYYYYTTGYASFLADTFQVANKAQLRLQLADSLPSEVLKKWYIGRMSISLRRNMREQLTDSTNRRFLKVLYNGKRPPLRPRVILRDMKLRPRQAYSYDNYMLSMQKVNSTGVFSQTDFQFTPRPGTDTLDLSLNCIFDKPYDVYFEANLINRTIGRLGPEAKIGFTRRNVFHGGEKLDVNLHGSYEWDIKSSGIDNNSYQYGADASIEFPRIIAPFVGESNTPRRQKDGTRRRPRRYVSTPWTIAKLSTDIVRRPGYYKMRIVSAEWTYRWQTSEKFAHEFSPLTLKYQFLSSTTEKFNEIVGNNPYLMASMSDYFIPKMRYTLNYKSAAKMKNPIRWETTVEEAGNLTALWDLAGGHRWNEKDKTLFRNSYSQFLRAETSLTKTWNLDNRSQLVGHLGAGVLWWFGNSSDFPFSEGFYVGGANSIRAFAVRSIGPGAYPNMNDRQLSYIMQTGNSKFEANLEYRRRLFGDLYGAVFLDAGNIWSTRNWSIDIDAIEQTEGTLSAEERAAMEQWNDMFSDCKFRPHKFFKQLATGTGIGLRYDLEFLVLRVDWGLGLHVPYDTGRSSYFNITRFRDMHTLHIAIGYPF